MRTIKKITLTGLTMLVILGIAISAQSASIVGSRHDLHWALTLPDMGFWGTYNDYGEVCVYCHTPHGANSAGNAPLWNRNYPTGPYIPYDSPTMDKKAPDMPNSESLACLSCHDGTIAVDEILNMPGTGWSPSGERGTLTALDSWPNPGYGYHGKLTTTGDAFVNCAVACHGGSLIAGTDFTAGALGTDLSNDHPISMAYPSTGDDPFFKTTAEVASGGLKLFGGTNTVECSSCHNVHDPANKPFLRKSNTGSALCYTCHDK
jgi:predicted CXXCH cytochrome family protein